MSNVCVHSYALVAQLVEQQTFNLMVEGSIPSERTPVNAGHENKLARRQA